MTQKRKVLEGALKKVSRLLEESTMILEVVMVLEEVVQSAVVQLK